MSLFSSARTNYSTYSSLLVLITPITNLIVTCLVLRKALRGTSKVTILSATKRRWTSKIQYFLSFSLVERKKFPRFWFYLKLHYSDHIKNSPIVFHFTNSILNCGEPNHFFFLYWIVSFRGMFETCDVRQLFPHFFRPATHFHFPAVYLVSLFRLSIISSSCSFCSKKKKKIIRQDEKKACSFRSSTRLERERERERRTGG